MYKVNTKALKQALTHAAQVIEKRSTMPVLSNVLLSARGSGLSIEATDLELSHSETIDAYAIGGQELPWSIAVNCKQVLNYIKTLDQKSECTLDVDGNKLNINNSSFQGVSAEDYPMLSKPSDGTTTQLIETTVLLALLEATAHAMSTDQTRYHLNGIYLESTKDGWKATSTDGHRLHHLTLASIAHSNAKSIGRSWIIPAKAVKTMISRLRKYTGPDVVLYIDGPWMHVSAGAILSIRLIDGIFPNYPQLIPSRASHTFIANGEMLAVCKRLAPMTGKSNGVRMDFCINRVTMTAFNVEEATESVETLNVACDFELKTGFNVDYLIDALDVIGGEITWKFTDGLSPLLLTRSNAPLAVIMPMRV